MDSLESLRSEFEEALLQRSLCYTDRRGSVHNDIPSSTPSRRSSRGEVQQDLQRYQEECAALKEENQGLQRRIADMEISSQAYRETKICREIALRDRIAELERRQGTGDYEEDEIKRAEAVNKYGKSTITRLEQRLSESQHNYNDVMQQLRQERDVIAGLRHDIGVLEEEHHKRQNVTAEAQRGHQQHKVDMLEDRVNEGEINDLHVTGEPTSLDSQTLEDVHQELARMTGEVANVRQEMQRVEHSVLKAMTALSQKVVEAVRCALAF